MAGQLLAWYDRHRRKLAWRAEPGIRPDPYKVWLSEIMLQQTTVATVDGYFRKFVDKWPTVDALASAELDQVLRLWAGLGYYARARNLHRCARLVASELGVAFPGSEIELMKLPGIGPYTAAAIAAIAFDRPAAAVDGNVERVISRLFAIEVPLPDAKPDIRTRTRMLVPDTRSGDFAQALMDLGAMVCTRHKPNCLLCPWQGACRARALGIVETLPRKRPKPDRPTRYGIAFWIENSQGKVLLRRRPEKGLLGGMMEIPSTEWSPQQPAMPEHQAPVATDWQPVNATVEHTFTHFHLKLNIWRAAVTDNSRVDADGDIDWVRPGDMADYALPTVMRKIVARMAPPEALKRRP